MAQRACAGCGAATPPRRARFCPSCGAPLVRAGDRADAGRQPAGADDRPVARRLPTGLMGLAGLVVVAGATALAVGAGSGPLTTAADRDDEVALAPDDRDDDGAVDDPAADGGLTATEVPEDGCEPGGCERWRAEVGNGDTLVVGDRIVHHSTTRLSVVDAADGEVLVDVETEAPAGTGRLQVTGTGDGQRPAVILPGPTGFEVRELADGSLRWSADTEQGPRTPVVRDELVLTTDASRPVSASGCSRSPTDASSSPSMMRSSSAVARSSSDRWPTTRCACWTRQPARPA